MGEKYFYSIILKIVFSVLQTGHFDNFLNSKQLLHIHRCPQLQNKMFGPFSMQITHSSVLKVLVTLMTFSSSSSSSSSGTYSSVWFSSSYVNSSVWFSSSYVNSSVWFYSSYVNSSVWFAIGPKICDI